MQAVLPAWLLQVLDVLEEVAFEAEFLSTRIEKERRAIQAEAQMMNTIEYRVDCQLLQYLHEENALGFRFPIGKMERVGTPHPHAYLPICRIERGEGERGGSTGGRERGDCSCQLLRKCH